MLLVDKMQVLAVLRDRCTRQLEGLIASQKQVQEGAVHPESKQEHSKDTRATEAGYLARGLAERVELLRDGVRKLDLMRLRTFEEDDAVAAGALVSLLRGDDSEAIYFLAPAGGGEVLDLEGLRVLVVTPQSPVGAAVAGRRCGDSVAIDLPGGTTTAEIGWVR